MDYKDTVNLPKTSFPMRANLGKLEQELLQRWEQEHIYQQLRQGGPNGQIYSARWATLRQRPHPFGHRL